MKPAAIVVDPLIAKMIGSVPDDAGELRDSIKAAINALKKADNEKHVFLRKYTGAGSIRGMLDHVDDDVPINTVDSITRNIMPGNLVIAPLNDDTIYPGIKRAINADTIVFPVVHPLVSSKHCRDVLFPGNTPFFVYIPPSDLSSVDHARISSRFEERGIEAVMIKDDLGYHSGRVIPYIIAPAAKIDEVLPTFARKCSRLYDPCGIVVDEFVGGVDSTVTKVHAFGEVIPGEVLRYRVRLRGLDGIFKSNDPGMPDLLESVEMSEGSIDEATTAMINDAARKYFPVAMASVDMATRNDGKQVIIDVNGRAGSFGELQEQSGSNDHNPFDFIASKVSSGMTSAVIKRAIDPGIKD